MWRITSSFVLIVMSATVAIAAPLKEKEQSLPAPTDKQFADSLNCLKQLGLGVHNFHDVYNKMPANLILDKKPALSWRVHLLPYLDEGDLYKSFKLNEPWDSENNKKLIEKIPKVFQPVRGRFKKGETFYQMFNWEGGILRPDSTPVGLAGVADGLSNTLLIVEGGSPVIWTKPDDIPYDGGKTLPKLGGMFDGDFNAVMGDGSCVRIPKNLDAETLHRVIHPNDGNAVDLREAIEAAKKK